MKKIKIGIIGNTIVGKTSMCRNYLGEEFSKEEIGTATYETYEKDFEYIKNEETIKTKIFIYDTGSERYDSLMNNYIKKFDGVLLIYAIDNLSTFDDIQKWVKQKEK